MYIRSYLILLKKSCLNSSKLSLLLELLREEKTFVSPDSFTGKLLVFKASMTDSDVI
jgi:hypothetical protein